MEMNSYEDLIFAWEDPESDYNECTHCEHKENCHNQCMKIEYIYNPVIQAYLNKRR